MLQDLREFQDARRKWTHGLVAACASAVLLLTIALALGQWLSAVGQSSLAELTVHIGAYSLESSAQLSPFPDSTVIEVQADSRPTLTLAYDSCKQNGKHPRVCRYFTALAVVGCLTIFLCAYAIGALVSAGYLVGKLLQASTIRSDIQGGPSEVRDTLAELQLGSRNPEEGSRRAMYGRAHRLALTAAVSSGVTSLLWLSMWHWSGELRKTGDSPAVFGFGLLELRWWPGGSLLCCLASLLPAALAPVLVDRIHSKELRRPVGAGGPGFDADLTRPLAGAGGAMAGPFMAAAPIMPGQLA